MADLSICSRVLPGVTAKRPFVSHAPLVLQQIVPEEWNHCDTVKQAPPAKTASHDRAMRRKRRSSIRYLGHESAGPVGLSSLTKSLQSKLLGKKVTRKRSAIDNFGIFAAEPVLVDELIIEYVGEKIRTLVADVREVKYQRAGIGKDYFFRVDDNYVIDATRFGNNARFINHSCQPNAYTRILTVNGSKVVGIYAKQPIQAGEEITYNYKFPRGEKANLCYCGASSCRGIMK